jgi:thiamine biosynthesis lipoprotein
VERETFLMGTRLRVSVQATDPDAGIAAIEAAFAKIRRLEEALSSWRDDSQLSRLNSAPPGVPRPISADLLTLLHEVQQWASLSGGAFDPAIGPLIDVWDLRGAGRLPSRVELAGALAETGPGAFELDADAGTVTRRRPGSWMTAGGFGKGAALRAAGRVLEEAGVEAAILDFGGQLLAIGSPRRGEGWVVGVAHPSRRGRSAAVLRLQGRSAATSAASERFVEIDGVRYGHILDPRTGWPVRAWGSVTVVAEDPLLADMVSTTLFVLGPDAGMAWAEALQEDVAVLFLREEHGGLEATWNRAMEPWLVRVVDNETAGSESPRASGERFVS